jgi:hypothetical protein
MAISIDFFMALVASNGFGLHSTSWTVCPSFLGSSLFHVGNSNFSFPNFR